MLTHPVYESDQRTDAASPLQEVDQIQMPGLKCSACQETWANSRKLYLPINDHSLAKRLNGWPLPIEEWLALAKLVRQSLDLPSDFVIQPGDSFGIPVFELRSTRFPDIMYPFPGQIIVSSSVAESLRDAGFTGYRLIECQIRWNSTTKRRLPPDRVDPSLFVLSIEGTAWSDGINANASEVCFQCGRPLVPDEVSLVVDAERWDGSDFFNLNGNPNIVMVTERVCEFLAQHDYKNYLCTQKLPD